MHSNIKLGKISGIEIGLHYSWFLIAALIVFSFGEHLRKVNPHWGTGQIWIAALLTGVLFFVTLQLHELSHSLVAQARGMKVKAITLFARGGVSQIQEDASDAKTEFWVAITGPIASLIIGLGCLAMAVGLGWQRSSEPRTLLTAILVWLGYINIGLAVFNMIPGFPLDGGRVPVVENSALQGMLSRSHLMQLLQARSEFQPPAARHLPLHRMKQKGATP